MNSRCLLMSRICVSIICTPRSGTRRAAARMATNRLLAPHVGPHLLRLGPQPLHLHPPRRLVVLARLEQHPRVLGLLLDVGQLGRELGAQLGAGEVAVLDLAELLRDLFDGAVEVRRGPRLRSGGGDLVRKRCQLGDLGAEVGDDGAVRADDIVGRLGLGFRRCRCGFVRGPLGCRSGCRACRGFAGRLGGEHLAAGCWSDALGRRPTRINRRLGCGCGKIERLPDRDRTRRRRRLAKGGYRKRGTGSRRRGLLRRLLSNLVRRSRGSLAEAKGWLRRGCRRSGRRGRRCSPKGERRLRGLRSRGSARSAEQGLRIARARGSRCRAKESAGLGRLLRRLSKQRLNPVRGGRQAKEWLGHVRRGCAKEWRCRLRRVSAGRSAEEAAGLGHRRRGRAENPARLARVRRRRSEKAARLRAVLCRAAKRERRRPVRLGGRRRDGPEREARLGRLPRLARRGLGHLRPLLHPRMHLPGIHHLPLEQLPRVVQDREHRHRRPGRLVLPRRGGQRFLRGHVHRDAQRPRVALFAVRGCEAREDGAGRLVGLPDLPVGAVPAQDDHVEAGGRGEDEEAGVRAVVFDRSGVVAGAEGGVVGEEGVGDGVEGARVRAGADEVELVLGIVRVEEVRDEEGVGVDRVDLRHGWQPRALAPLPVHGLLPEAHLRRFPAAKPALCASDPRTSAEYRPWKGRRPDRRPTRTMPAR
ncbi:hypothetical protein DFJ74DRAFT_411522 [Hyaloraphidium curvatum]|nr:hypothetical protein DFJ74DRAFT_411522 [Hyaloraphidium curvatum]